MIPNFNFEIGSTYGVERVRELISHVHPTGILLLLRARLPHGCCIATGIFPAMNQTMYFWGGASWRQYQHLLPNEAIQWYAMKYWKERGIRVYDFGGCGEYKENMVGVKLGLLGSESLSISPSHACETLPSASSRPVKRFWGDGTTASVPMTETDVTPRDYYTYNLPRNVSKHNPEFRACIIAK